MPHPTHRHGTVHFLGLLVLSLILSTLPAHTQTSELWGNQGELWNPASRLPDFSFAGYQSAAAAIPTPPVIANVMDFGAAGNGIADDTSAFELAIASASNGAVFIPAGRYRITRVLYIRKSNLVLRGAGQGLTTLVFPNHLTQLLGSPPGTAGLESWSWSGGLIWAEGNETTTRIANVIANTTRGNQTLSLSSTAGLSVGQTIRLMMTDPDGSLGRHIHADQLDAHPTLVGRRLIRFPSRIIAISGNEITLERPLKVDVRTSWSPEIHSSSGLLEQVGLEGFTIEFPTRPYKGHFQEDGFNGIWMDGTTHSWVRNVTVHNCENGILIERSAFCSLDQISLTAATGNRLNISGTYYTGHHGIQFRRSDDCMTSNFTIPTRFYHDLTVEDATGCVFMKGSGVDVNFDHHTYLPFENLFTQINCGVGTRHFASSGSRNPESAARETLWNISSTNAITVVPNPAAGRGIWPQPNLIGINTTLAASRDPVLAWIEPISPPNLIPTNLYEAQLSRRLSPPPVTARSLTWDGGGIGTPGAQGGSGTWNTASTSNWWNSSANEPWPVSGNTDDSATFAGTAGTVTIASSGVVTRNITVTTPGYLLNGGPIILNGENPTLSISGGSSCNVESIIGGSSGITKAGPSTLQLRAANRYQGDTRVTQGTLLIGAGNNRLPVSTRLILGEGANNGVFQMNSRSQQIAGLLSNGIGTNNRVINSNVVTSTFTILIPNDSENLLFNGTLGGTGTNDNNFHLVKSGLGTQTLAGDCTYTGSTTILAGTLQIGDDGPVGTLTPAPVTNNGTLRFDRTGTLTVTSPISGSGSLRIDGPANQGTIALRASNTFLGYVTLSSGTLNIDRSDALGTNEKTIDITTGLGTLQLDGSALSIPASITLNTSGEAAPGRIHNLSGENTVSGPINLSIGAGNTLISSDAGSLTLEGSITAPSASRSLRLGGISNAQNQITGNITETGTRVISLEKTGTGTWELAGANSHSGVTLVTAGSLVISHHSALGSTAAGTTISTGAKLQLKGPALTVPENLTFANTATLENLSGENSLTGSITRSGAITFIATAGKLTILSPIGNTSSAVNLQGDGEGELAGSITSASTVTKTGTGTWTLSAPSTHTNSTTVNGGRLVLTSNLAGPLTVFSGTLAPQGSPLTSSSLNLQPSATLRITPGHTFTVAGSVTLGGTLEISAPPGIPPGTSYTIIDKTSPGAISGTFSGRPQGSTFSANGYTWRISYNGGNGNDITLTTVPTSAMESWRLLHFATTANTGSASNSADPDNDGETNLIEFATGQNPLASTRCQISFATTPSSVTFTYSRNQAAANEGYIFDVQFSNTLAEPWTSHGPGTLAIDGPLQTLTLTLTNITRERHFARLKVTAP